jgi:hypothetical protein
MADLPPESQQSFAPPSQTDDNIQAGWPVVVGVVLIAIAVIIIMFVVTR